ncbi:MAG TPA: sulfotransferase family 2 domain-containing protein [Saprospiraceae bacterium]|nr:sulfotransferase family 2 domain-containing protein [Saprospiraceae bacterium]
MTSLSGTLRQYVRKHNVHFAKDVYRSVVVPLYDLISVPLYDITASSQYRYTWFRIPKNGTHSIMQILNIYAPAEINSSYVPYYRKEHRDNFRFCVIRNPWDRLVSVYCNKVLMRLMYPECWDKDFDYFIEFVSRKNLRKCDGHLKMQTAMFPPDDIDYVCRMEQFEVGMEYIMGKLGIECRVAHEGQVMHPDYRSFYTAALAERVRSLYALDVEYGNYSL